MKWEVKKTGDKWGVFLMQKYCKTDDPVCYGASLIKETTVRTADRLNNPIYKEKI